VKLVKIFGGIVVIAGLLFGGYYLFLDNVVKTTLDDLENQNNEKAHFSYGEYKIDPFNGTVLVSDINYKQQDIQAETRAKTVKISLFEGKVGSGLIGQGSATEITGYGTNFGKFNSPTLEFRNINLNTGSIGYLRFNQVNMSVDKERAELMISEEKGSEELKLEDLVSTGSAEEVIYEDTEIKFFTEFFNDISPEFVSSLTLGKFSVKNLKMDYPLKGETFQLGEIQIKGLQGGELEKLIVKGVDLGSPSDDASDKDYFRLKSLEMDKLGLSSFVRLAENSINSKTLTPPAPRKKHNSFCMS